MPVVLAAAVAACTTSAYAQTVSLQSLLDGGTITSDNLLFSNFSGHPVGTISVDLNQVYVVAEPGGIQFQSSLWNISGASQSYDLSLSFDVTTTDGSTIDWLSSLITGASVGTGTSTLSENALDQFSQTLGSTMVYINRNGSTDLLNTIALSSGETTIVINKDFGMSTAEGDASAQITVSHFDQTFTTVPEPSTVALGILGGLSGLGLLCLRRRS